MVRGINRLDLEATYDTDLASLSMAQIAHWARWDGLPQNGRVGIMLWYVRVEPA